MDRSFPEILKKLHEIEIDYADGEGIDFEPFDEFYSEEETSDWIKAWTGNDTLDGNEYLIYGQDGTGGYVAFWCVRKNADLLEQPIVFFGSEGEVGVVAQSFGDYVWLFANGIGPYEAVAYPDLERPKSQDFIRFATEYAPSSKSTASQIVEKAKAEFPDFEGIIDRLCQ
ncbi:SMI1/KNR4 family protein [Shewanella woodyi]|uniref:SMI1/KNR4 family protein n=1 Tax=Shewanella woodyi TaxID=60961 RepID=UPI0007F94675|nr:SMI1/KNR4 family protein [Shewanella woodyi]